MGDGVLDADPSRCVGFPLRGTKLRDVGHAFPSFLVGPHGGGDDLAGGLCSESWVAGVGEDLHPAGVLEPVDPASLPGLGDVGGAAPTPRPAEQQPSVGIAGLTLGGGMGWWVESTG
ncbi:hypothetical protein GCM10012275_30240 [Longimycelium tulufanense]|uniref:Uncharacterized protein n=1 Tax=Longimycelium tulufanense TaxID=907463 RepID=A0A8J3CGD9_9PSEU|nr:hypothetical protein GCM10012275_30240 [Longimycelium tulufanense]